MIIETPRLILRQWRDSDREPYASFNGDAETRRFYPTILSRSQSNAIVDRFIRGIEEDGHGFWAVERKSDGVFLGDVGYAPVEMPLKGNPPVEIGWIIGRPFWGNGYATEAALGALDHAFNFKGFSEVVAFTAHPNAPSQRVMQKIGMTHDPEGDFEHPKVPVGHWLRAHVLYRMSNPQQATS
ncbi:N-acetyltransferase [Devosia pacifica]|uniref:N-acetyltransferase n=1 Tax=Devosia pacifica TaxID=1335967 RepID=A0A918RWV2_9HYPH|nr:GNAT family N-acetyltransferase [Devosia pacifica]GHA15723.1 N-acetyltransferase [Devosia pacifica]